MDDHKLREAIKIVLLAGNYISLNSNVRISPTSKGYVVKDYLHWRDAESFTPDQLDAAIDCYFERCAKST